MLEAIFQSSHSWLVHNSAALLQIAQTVNVLALLGLTSALLSAFAFVPYIRDTLSGRTQPQRASWLIWSVLSSIALASQVAQGATSAVWFTLFQVLGTITVFVATFVHGSGRGGLRAGDVMVLSGAALGLVFWSVTDSPMYAMTTVIAISALGGWATVKKAYASPDTETLSTWVLSFAAGCLAVLAVGAVDIALLAYPLYLSVLYGAILLAVTLGRARQRKTAAAMLAMPSFHQPAD